MNMTVASPKGRWGNQIIISLAVNLIAEKHNLMVHYTPGGKRAEMVLGIQLYQGSKKHNNVRILRNDNFMDILNQSTIDYSLVSDDFFQTKEICNLMYEYLRNNQKESIISKNPFHTRYENNNDLFIHLRLGDMAKRNPGIDYYLECIERIEYDNIYFATDSFQSPMIHRLKEKYPTIQYIKDESVVIQFGSTCKHVVLSHGSFSAIIGYLSFFSDVYYPNYSRAKIGVWFGDMFSIPGWIEV